MVDEVITKQELIDAQKDAQSLDDFINGDDEQIVVTRLLKEYPTLANAIRQIYEKGGKFYPTLADANADIANIRTDVYVITGDNGAYYKATAEATSLTKSPYDPSKVSENYTNQKLDQAQKDIDKNFQRALNSEVNIDDILIALTDNKGRRTWLEVDNDDGGLTDYAKFHLFNALSSKLYELDTEYFYALSDNRGYLTDLTLKNNGQFADFVIDRLKKRLDIKVSSNSKDRYLRNNQLAWLNTDMSKIAGWGSSSMDRCATSMSAIATEYEASYIDGGVGGDWYENIAARMGAIPAKVKFQSGQINASGTQQVTMSVGGYTIPIRSAAGNFSGTVNGVHGTFQYISAGSAFVNFVRTTAGSAITVDPNREFEVVVDNIETYKKAVTLLWAGKNNITYEADTILDTSERVIAGTDTMFKFLEPQSIRTLVLTHYTNGDYTVDGYQMQRLNAVNAAYKSKYKELCVDVQGWLMSSQVWVDTNITPTSQDLTDQSSGIVPASLRVDNGHLTNVVFGVMCEKLIKTKFIELGWY